MKGSLTYHTHHAVKTGKSNYFIHDKRKKTCAHFRIYGSLLASSNNFDEQEVKPANDNEYETLQRIFSDNIEKQEISTNDVREADKEHTLLRENVQSVYLKLRYMISKLEPPPLPSEWILQMIK